MVSGVSLWVSLGVPGMSLADPRGSFGRSRETPKTYLGVSWGALGVNLVVWCGPWVRVWVCKYPYFTESLFYIYIYIRMYICIYIYLFDQFVPWYLFSEHRKEHRGFCCCTDYGRSTCCCLLFFTTNLQMYSFFTARFLNHFYHVFRRHTAFLGLQRLSTCCFLQT